MKIAIDVVGVLLDNMVTFLKIYNDIFKTEYDREDFSHWEFFKELNLTTEEFLKLFYKTFEYPEEIPFIDDEAPKYMRRLNQMHDLYILSALDSNYKNSLKNQLEFNNIKQNIHYKEMLIVPETPYDLKLKSEFDIYVDDNPNLVEPIKNLKNRYLLLFNQPGNQNSICEQNVIRVNNWKEIYEIIQNIIN
ncbi:MAG: hypothetical protein ACFFC3_00645 [Candidatus Odinarchaeota archaeon]